MEGFYLYGLVGFPPELSQEIPGLGGSPVFLVSHRDLAAVVSRSPLSRWPVDEAHLTLHETVVEEVMGSRTILPIRFNTFLRTEEAVVALLDERAQAFQSVLERVEGKVEIGLRVLWEPPGEAEAPAEQEIKDGGPGAGYLYRRLNEARRRTGLRATGAMLIQELQSNFLSVAVEGRLRRFPTERLLFTAAYLVKRNRVDAFRKAVAKAGKDFSCLSLLLTGPWPPYHFVNGALDEIKDTLSA